jgi:LPXTG-motif cell wall-anchored protein
MKNILLLTILLSIPAIAQTPVAPSLPPAGTVASSTTTVTTVVEPKPVPTVSIVAEEPTTLPNTGGTPLILALIGTGIAGGAFLLRKKLS